MTDFRNLQYYLSQLCSNPTAEEYYLEGYSLLRECTTQAQAILAQPFSASPSSGAERDQLRRIILDAAVRRFQCQRLYLRAHAALRWVNARNSVLRGQKQNAQHLGALGQADATLRTVCLWTIGKTSGADEGLRR